jgi:multiple sugar transport system substrate-binding protein
MEELDFSVMSYTPARVDKLRSLLEEFEAAHHVRVNVQTLPWETSWSEILKFVFQGHGPAVSEVGNTWVVSLAKMNALRAFKPGEISAIGGEKAFLSGTWSRDTTTDSIWSVPWLAESRVIFYWRDLLEEAGVDEAEAFGSQDQLEQTLEKLAQKGSVSPLVVPTARTLNTVHNLASWIWGTGGSFVDAKQRRVTIADPEATAGIRNYYALHPYIRPEFHGLDPYQVDGVFEQRKTAVTFNGPWVIFYSEGLPRLNMTDKIGVAPLPSVSPILASDLVIWKHMPVRLERLSVELVKFLTADKAQSLCSRHVGLIPARLETLETPPFSVDPFYQVFGNALKSGQTLPAMRLWGLIEERLTLAFANIWSKVLADPNPDLNAIIEGELEPLSQKLNRILE